MTIQTVEIAGRRYVIIPEGEFQKLAQKSGAGDRAEARGVPRRRRFAPFTPLKASGIPASEVLIQDRR